MQKEFTTNADSEILMRDLLFIIELSLTCLKMHVRVKKEVVDQSILAEVEYAVTHYVRCALVNHIDMNANQDKPISLSGSKKDLIGYSTLGLLNDVMNHGRLVVYKVKKMESIEEQIEYLFSTAQDDFASHNIIEYMDQVINTKKPLVGNLSDKHFFDGLLNHVNIENTNEWSMKYMPKVDILWGKLENVKDLILEYNFDDYLDNWVSVLDDVINTVSRKLSNITGKSQMIGVLFLLTLFKEAGLNVKDERSLKEFLETILDIDKITVKTYLHRLKNRNENLYKSREGYFDTAIEQIKSLFDEDTELRRKLIQNFESYKRDRQTISEVLPPNRLTKND